MKKIIFFLICSSMLLGCHRGAKNLFFGAALENLPKAAEISIVKKETGKSFAIVEFYADFDSSIEGIAAALDDIWKSGSVACLSIEPKNSFGNLFYEDLLSGAHDPFLKQLASKFLLFKQPLIIRFAQEMNLSSYHWGSGLEDFGPKSPWIYKVMFRYMSDFFKRMKVDNILWAFCPNCDSLPDPQKASWNDPLNYYPGGEYVDIVGMDGYSDCKEFAKKRSFEEIFTALYKELSSLKKPIFIFETAAGKGKKEYLESALPLLSRWKIEVIIWFWADKECDWRVYSQDLTDINAAEGDLFQKWAAKKIEEKKR